MIDDVAIGVVAALVAGALASEGGGAGQVIGAVRVALAFVPTADQRRSLVTRQARAHRHLIHHLALGIVAAWAGLACRLCNGQFFHYTYHMYYAHGLYRLGGIGGIGNRAI